MSTRCNIEFYDDQGGSEFGEPAARIYKHGDGYPDGVLPLLADLAARLKGLKGSMYGCRLSDPEWAAAEFVTMFRQPMGGDIYVSQQLHGDIEYLYRVVCSHEGLDIHVFTRKGSWEFPTFEEITEGVNG